MSKVSIIVPIYNAEKKLNKCIKSILNQTFKDFELILVNDGSTDDSLAICKKYQHDKRVIIIDKHNEGCIATRRKGIEAANSDYIMFVDADDWIDSKTVATLYNEGIKSEADITVCNTYRVLGGTLIKKKNKSRYFNGTKIFNKQEIKKDLVVAFLYGHPFPSSLCAKLYKKELLENSGKYLERICFFGEDLYFNLEIFLKANRVKVIDTPLYYYRIGGFTNRYMAYLFDDMVNGYEIQKEVIDEHYINARQLLYNGISIMLLNTFKTCLSNLFNSALSYNEMKQLIREYVANNSVIETLSNKGAMKYFPQEFLDAIRNKNIEYLFNLGRNIHKRQKPKKALVNVLSKLSII